MCRISEIVSYWYIAVFFVAVFSISLIAALRPRKIAEVMLGRSVILTTLFLSKPPKGRLPVLSVHSFALN